jgi:myxalamid-type polyketide synthase MxaE and MxaD
VHAAATLGPATLEEVGDDDIAAMLRPKVAGAWLLHELSLEHPVDHFVLFSSTTAVWGSQKLGHYAAANQVLDAVAHVRRSAGLPALAVDWGTWDEMRVASAADRDEVSRGGLLELPSDGALNALGDLLADPGPAEVVVAAVDWSVFKPLYEARRPRPFFSLVGPAPASSPSASPAVAVPILSARLQEAPPATHRDVVVAYLRDEVARALGVARPEAVDVGQGLFEMGMDSLMSVELKARIEVAVGVALPSTLTFNYPNIDALAGYLVEHVLAPADGADLRDDGSATPVADESPVRAATTTATDDLSDDELASLLADRLGRLR